MAYPLYCCPKCGALVGLVGRLMMALHLPVHRCDPGDQIEHEAAAAGWVRPTYGSGMRSMEDCPSDGTPVLARWVPRRGTRWIYVVVRRDDGDPAGMFYDDRGMPYSEHNLAGWWPLPED